MERYLATMEFFIYAEDDKKAKSKAEYIQGKQKYSYDNQACITKLESSPFGRFPSEINLMKD